MNDAAGMTTRSLVLRLAAKDVYLNRQMMIAVLVAGLASLILAGTGNIGYSIGSISFITAVMAFAVVLAMFNIAQERKERGVLFVLSLPLAPQDYVRAKLLGTALTFFIPWVVLTVGALVVVTVTRIPDGLLPMTLLLLVYFLCTFSVMVAVALIVSSDAKTTLWIIITNMSVTLFMVGIGRMPGIGGQEGSATPLWSGPFFAVLAAELTLIVIALAVPLYYHSRKRDFI